MPPKPLLLPLLLLPPLRHPYLQHRANQRQAQILNPARQRRPLLPQRPVRMVRRVVMGI
jgi:hypothetical protein